MTLVSSPFVMQPNKSNFISILTCSLYTFPAVMEMLITHVYYALQLLKIFNLELYRTFKHSECV